MGAGGDVSWAGGSMIRTLEQGCISIAANSESAHLTLTLDPDVDGELVLTLSEVDDLIAMLTELRPFVGVE